MKEWALRVESIFLIGSKACPACPCNKSTVSPQRVYLAIVARTAEKIVSREREKSENITEDPPSSACWQGA
jgi:hypothetical protein